MATCETPAPPFFESQQTRLLHAMRNKIIHPYCPSPNILIVCPSIPHRHQQDKIDKPSFQLRANFLLFRFTVQGELLLGLLEHRHLRPHHHPSAVDELAK